MKISIQSTFSIFVFLILSMQSFASSDIDPTLFYEGSFENAKAKAGEEGKLFLVDFYANWCTPCKWMDKTTFKDESLRSLLDESFVSLKVDIDQPEGYRLKEQFEVRMLPTILIFNSQGKMIERIEKTVTAEGLTTILSFHNQSKNKVVQKHHLNKSPREAQFDNFEIQEDYSKIYNDYRKSQRRKTNYRVQVADYDNYEEAFVRVNELRDQFIEPIIVLNDFRNGSTYYKVLLGEFRSMEEAESFRVILQNQFNITGIIN